MFNAHADDFVKTVESIVAEKVRSKHPKAKEEGLLHMLDAMLEEMKSPD